MVVAIIVTSAAVPLLGWDVAQLRDIADIPNSLPRPMLPLLSAVPSLIIPALSLAFIGLVQGAGISANFPEENGDYPDASRDFVGQGAANVAVGFFQGMPVGGSMSASSLVKNAGAKSRMALLIAAVVMAIVIVVFGSAVGYIAMPALAGLLMIVGYRTVKPADIKSVWKTGTMQAMVMSVTFVLTMIIPLQNAVLVGVGISMILFVINQSNRVTIKRWLLDDSGNLREVEPPAEVGDGEVVVLQPYGSLFFAAAPVFEELLPDVSDATQHSVVILRLRGRTDLGSTFMDVLRRYAEQLSAADSKLVIISGDERVHEQLAVTRVTAVVGSENLYTSDEWVGATLKRAYAESVQWVSEAGSSDDLPDASD
jgi:SulP family sulfate permease